MKPTKDAHLPNKAIDSIESRLEEYGISKASIPNPGIDHSTNSMLISTAKVISRVMILRATFYAVLEYSEFEKTKAWLRQEGLWPFLSAKETLFYNRMLDYDMIDDFMWNMEKAYILAWAANLVHSKPSPEDLISDLLYEELTNGIPPVRAKGLMELIDDQQLRDPQEIYEEKLFNELLAKGFSASSSPRRIDYEAVNARSEALKWVCDNDGTTWE